MGISGAKRRRADLTIVDGAAPVAGAMPHGHVQHSAPQQGPPLAVPQQPVHSGPVMLGVPGEQPPEMISAGQIFTWSSNGAN